VPLRLAKLNLVFLTRFMEQVVYRVTTLKNRFVLQVGT
jgi:hypothetical protein